MKYKILKSEHVTHLENAYQIKLINETIEGTEGTDYIHTMINNVEFLFLKSEVKEIKEKIVKTNKTKVQNSIIVDWQDDKKIEDVKLVLKIKRALKQRSVTDDIEDIKYYYNRLVDLYVCACRRQGVDDALIRILDKTVLEILKSNIEIEPYYKKEAESIIKWKY